jgi:hypothetical protein
MYLFLIQVDIILDRFLDDNEKDFETYTVNGCDAEAV